MKKSINLRRFRVALAERGLRQFEVAAQAGLDPTKLSHLLHGRLSPTATESALPKIEATLGLDPGTLAIVTD